MHSDKKITKEDTWKPADLMRHIRDGGHRDVRRRDDTERKPRVGGDSVERHHRDPEKESRRERDKHREQDSTRERGKSQGRERDRHPDRRKEASRDRREDKEERDRERRKERDRVVDTNKYSDEYRENKDRRRDREEKENQDGERDKERHRDKEKVKIRETERGTYREERRRDKEEDGERRHKERGQHEEKRRHDREPSDRKSRKGSGGHQRSAREPEERDKPKERRQREEQDPDRNHRDRTGTKKPASDQSHKTAETKVANDEQSAEDPGYGDQDHHGDPGYGDQDHHGDQGYEDDFEDYEEDFEEVDDSVGVGEEEEEEEEVREKGEELTAKRREEIKAIQRAMTEENERVGTAQSSTEEEERPKWSRESGRNHITGSPRGKFIDFVAAKQREVSKKVASKQKKRSTELLRLIDLDYSTTFSLLDLPPVNEYDMYIKSFGTANTKQVYVQCNEDNAERDIQTEEIELCEKWTQHPAERNGACGDPNLSQDARDKSMSETNVDSQRLTAFLRSASQVMVVLLEEDQAEKKSLRQPKTQTDTLSFSDGSLQLNTKLPFLYGRQVSMMHFSPAQKQTMMSVHSPTAKPSGVHLDSCTIICIWNIWEPSRPQKILVYECEVQCCCFSPGKATLVFAGTAVGSVVLWDLREHASNHYCLKIGDEEWTLRHPTFSTDAVLAGSGHLSVVSSVEVVSSTVAGGLRPEVPALASEEEASGMSFQLASLDGNGVLNFWVVLELPKANDAGSQTDLGLRPGGKVKLLHSSSLLTAER
ncbi:cytoplasmic dynein 2 intermediate chain 1-like [Diretmus argenteus]